MEFLSVRDLAALLNVPVHVVYGLRHRGEGPPATRVGRELRFARRDVERWLESRREPTPV